jgi:YVTN family beta-propeller protein
MLLSRLRPVITILHRLSDIKGAITARPRAGRGRRIVVAALALGMLAVLAVASTLAVAQSVVTTITVGTVPLGVGVNPNTNRIYVSNQYDSTVSVIDGATNTVIATIPVGLGPWGGGGQPNHQPYLRG